MKIQEKELLQYITNHPGATIKDMSSYFDVVSITIHRRVKPLLAQGIVIKKGHTPHVRYFPNIPNIQKESIISASIARALDQERYQITQSGKELIGEQGFITWCQKRKQEPMAASQRRYKSIQYIDSTTTSRGIDAMKKLYDYGGDILQNLRYGAIYALPEFGKTKQGTRMEIAKVQPNMSIFNNIMEYTQPYIQRIIQDHSIDGLCFAQPTAKRSMQIMKYSEKVLGNILPVLPLYKVPGYFPAQKTLRKREDRISNAKASFGLDMNNNTFQHVLIIDDAVGSGATLVEIGRKLLDGGYTKKVSAFSMTGTANGIFNEYKHFEVLTNV